MIYNNNDIRKLLLSKGYKLKGTVIHTKDNDTFDANLGISDASFRIITPSGICDFSEDWIKLLIQTYPQEENLKSILSSIEREKDRVTKQIHSKLEQLRDEMTEVRNRGCAYAEVLDRRKRMILLQLECSENRKDNILEK